MAEEKITKKDMEDIYIPKGYASEDPNHYIVINGKRWILPRGKTSTVPSFVAEEYRRSLRAQERFDGTSESFKSK